MVPGPPRSPLTHTIFPYATPFRSGCLRGDGERVDDHALLELLDRPDLARLLLDAEVLVDHADTAGLGHGDRQPALGDGVHRRRDQRYAELDGAGDLGDRKSTRLKSSH